MGVSSATEIFQHVIQHEVLKGFKNVRNLVDDIIVWGKTKEEHDECLEKLLTRLSEKGITVSKKNCEIGFKDLVFFGV